MTLSHPLLLVLGLLVAGALVVGAVLLGRRRSAALTAAGISMAGQRSRPSDAVARPGNQRDFPGKIHFHRFLPR